jgi:hypothetical protein
MGVLVAVGSYEVTVERTKRACGGYVSLAAGSDRPERRSIKHWY